MHGAAGPRILFVADLRQPAIIERAAHGLRARAARRSALALGSPSAAHARAKRQRFMHYGWFTEGFYTLDLKEAKGLAR